MGWVMVLVPAGLLLLGLPIFVVLLVTVALVLLFFMDVPATVAHQIVFGSLNSYALLAVPFFIFAGEVMSRGGISRRIIDWVLAIVGGLRGSLGLTTVATCTVFGAISGSSPATVAAVGRFLYPSLREKGYDERFASGVLTSSGALAMVIPPSIAMILYGASAEQAVSTLFIAGILPGLVLALFAALYVYYYAARRNIQEGESFRWSRLASQTKKSSLALGTPVIILGSIYAGIASPTEAAGVACVYAIVVTRLVYREVSWEDIWEISIQTVYLTTQVFLIVAAAGLFSWMLTIQGIPQQMAAAIAALKMEQWEILLMVNLFLLIVGAFIDPVSAILVLTPLLVPIMNVAGVDLIHFGIIMTVNLAIGMFTPPFGLNIFVAQAVLRAPVAAIYRGLLPFIVAYVAGLMVITYLPELSLVLTRYLG